MNKHTMIAGIIVTVILSGCSGTIGKQAASVPPRLVQVDSDNEIHPQKVVWRHAERFGPVPKELQAKGDQYCMRVNYGRAIGYHPKALGVQGAVIPGGGYYCVKRKS